MSAHGKVIPRLQVITDEAVQTTHSHAALAEMAARGGADAVQFREKRPWTARERIEVARACLDACRAHGALLLVDDFADVALAVGADAIHLGRNDLDVATARRIVGPDVVIGGTANSYEEAARVWTTDIDYIGVGPIYGTRSKANPAPDMGLDTLARICADSPVPVVAIGSITAERIPEVIAAGAYGVAVLSAVVSAADPVEATRRCREALDLAVAEQERGARA
ncbi:MAG: thiamine phosphate synthase [Chloroflexi bacterium]|nr:thiamine phosphate synthase [Chloroflexota bacterium]